MLDGILQNLLEPDDDLKKMTDMIKEEADNNIQVFEILETNSSDKFSKNNKIAALLNKSNNKVKSLQTNGNQPIITESVRYEPWSQEGVLQPGGVRLQTGPADRQRHQS